MKFPYIIFLFVFTVLGACNNNHEKKKVKKEQAPTIRVYNMGGAPQRDVDRLVVRLKDIYPRTVFSGQQNLVDSAYIHNDPKGKNRYRFKTLLAHTKRTVDTKNNIILVIVNADICTWTPKGTHANLGLSGLGNHISFVSYQRFKVNKLNSEDNIFKVAIHELGHSVVRLVAERKDLRHHCPNKKMLNERCL